MKTYELYDTGTEEILNTRQMDGADVAYANTRLRSVDSDCRWISKNDKDLPSNDCTCGAIYSYECVCN